MTPERQLAVESAAAEIREAADQLRAQGRGDRDLAARLAERDLDSRLAQIARIGGIEPSRRFSRD